MGDLDKLLDFSNQDLMELFRARARRKFSRGIKRGPITLLKKLRKAKRETAYGEKPEAVKTHLRNMVIVPEMIGSVVGVYNGKQYISVEIKPDMTATTWLSSPSPTSQLGTDVLEPRAALSSLSSDR